MDKKIYLFFAVVIITLIVLLYYFILNNSSKVNLIDSAEFEKISNEENVFILQAHTPYQEEIGGTDLVAENWENMDVYLDKLPKDKNTKMLVYCRSGRMSAVSAQQLVEMGYKNVYDLNGGMNSWKESGRKVIAKG